VSFSLFFSNATATTEIYTLSLHDALPIFFGYSPIRTPVIYSNGYVPAVGTGNQTNPWVVATQTGFNENWTNNIQTNINIEQNFRSEEHTSELQSRENLVCRLLLEKKKKKA